MADETTVVGNQDAIDISSIPNYIAIPNMRFGSTYLDTKYRGKAMKYEVMHDRVTGETLFRRGSDGKFVSFYQNFKYIHDLVTELSILVGNEVTLTLPEEGNGFYLNTNYDLDMINNNQHFNIYDQNNNTFFFTATTDKEVGTVDIPISRQTNGLFLRILSRDTDRPVIDYLTSVYNNYYMNYTGSNNADQIRAAKFTMDANWQYRNATVYYTVGYSTAADPDTVIGETVMQTADLRINESTFVDLRGPLTYMPATAKYFHVKIARITFDKLTIATNLIDAQTVGEDVQKNYAQLLSEDGHIEMRLLNSITFIDNETKLKDMTISNYIALLDMGFVYYYMHKVELLRSNHCITLSENRPEDTVWGRQCAWYQTIREVGEGSEINPINLPDYEDLIDYLRPKIMANVLYTQTPTDDDDILLRTIGMDPDVLNTTYTTDDTEENSIYLDDQE